MPHGSQVRNFDTRNIPLLAKFGVLKKHRLFSVVFKISLGECEYSEYLSGKEEYRRRPDDVLIKISIKGAK